MRYRDAKDMDAYSKTLMESEFYFSPLMILDEDENILLEVTTQNNFVWKTQDLDLTLVPELKDPFIITLPTNKSVNVTISVYDNDGASSTDDFTRDMTNMVPFSSTLAVEEWSEIVLDSPDKEANLTLRYRILECDEHFTGYGCNLCTEGWTEEMCDRCDTDYYPARQCTTFCEADTVRSFCTSLGERMCLENRRGEDCELCMEGWTGELCDSCAYGYYPKGSCSTYCDPVKGNYTCDPTSGQKTCAERKTGANCDRCSIYHFDEECSTFCKTTEYYTCSKGGEKICSDDNASPEDGCIALTVPEKNNSVMITGIVVGSVLLVSLLGNVILVYRLKKNDNQKDLNKQQDNTLVNPLYLPVVVDPAVAGRKEGPSNDQGGKKNESRIRFAEDTDVHVLGSSLDGNDAVYCIDESEDAEAFYSTLDDEGAMFRAGKNEDADANYSTLDDEGAMFSAGKNKATDGDATYSTLDEKDDTFCVAKNKDADATYSSLYREDDMFCVKDTDANYSTLDENDKFNSSPCTTTPAPARYDSNDSVEEDLDELYSTPHKDIGPTLSIPEKKMTPNIPGPPEIPELPDSLTDDHLADDLLSSNVDPFAAAGLDEGSSEEDLDDLYSIPFRNLPACSTFEKKEVLGSLPDKKLSDDPANKDMNAKPEEDDEDDTGSLYSTVNK